MNLRKRKYMKQKLKAVGMVASMVALATSTVLLIRLVLTNISTDTVPYIVGAGFLGIALYTLYSIFLAQIKYEDKIKEIAKK